MDDEFEYTQMPDDEMEAYLIRRERRLAAEAEAEKRRLAKRREFRFSGGML